MFDLQLHATVVFPACMHAGNHTERRGELDSFATVWLFVWGAAANNVTPGFLGLMFLDVFGPVRQRNFESCGSE